MVRTDEITNTQNVIDSRDVIARIEELESDVESDIATDEEKAELVTLKALAEEAEGYAADWQYGEAMIRDTYFADYAREMLEDCGTIPKDLPWYVVIDWEATANHIKADYTSVDFDGMDYWVRSC
jgi:hypothetical protein